MMYNPFFLTIGILILINLFEQIFRFWRKRFRPNLKKLYFITKSNVESRRKGHLTSKSNLPNLQKDFSTLKNTSAGVHIAVTTLKSVSAAVQKDISTLKSVSAVVPIAVTTLKSAYAVVQKDISTLNSVSAVLQKDFSRRKVFQQSCKKTFQHGKVFLQQFGYMIRTWNSIYKHLHIYYAASRSLSAALLIYIKTSKRNAPFLHRNFPMIMRFIYYRKQHVSR